MLQVKSTTEENFTKVFLNIDREGRIVRSLKNGDKEYFDFMSASLSSIRTREREYNGERVKVWNISLKDYDSREEYILSLRYESGVFRSIVLALASLPLIDGRTPISIHPYSRDGYTKVIVKYGETRLDWIDGGKNLPPMEEVVVGGKTYKDSQKRDAYIEGLVSQINSRILEA